MIILGSTIVFLFSNVVIKPQHIICAFPLILSFPTNNILTAKRIAGHKSQSIDHISHIFMTTKEPKHCVIIHHVHSSQNMGHTLC